MDDGLACKQLEKPVELLWRSPVPSPDNGNNGVVVP